MEQRFVKRVGGVLCLDFVNTVKGRVGSTTGAQGRDYADEIVGERLDSYDALRRWAAWVGLLAPRHAAVLARQAAERPRDAAAVLKRARAVREAMYRLFKAAIEGWPPRSEDLDVFNRELAVARAHRRLTASPGFQWAWDEEPSLDRVLWPVVESAGELLTGGGLARVGQCPGDECGWLFLDTSRSRRRQWCDMADCGNLAKVRRFRQQHRAGTT